MAQLMKAGPAIKRSSGSKKPVNKPATKTTPEKTQTAKAPVSKPEPKVQVTVASTAKPGGVRPVGINLREKAQEAIEKNQESNAGVSFKQPTVSQVAPIEPQKQVEQDPPFTTTQPQGVPQPKPYQPSGYEEKGTATISTQGHWGFGQLGQGYRFRN